MPSPRQFKPWYEHATSVRAHARLTIYFRCHGGGMGRRDAAESF